MIRYYVDFEFTKFNGDIISMAIVSDKSEELYVAYGQKELSAEANSAFEYIDPWVVKNVLPIIDTRDAKAQRIIGSRTYFREEMQRMMQQYFNETNPKSPLNEYRKPIMIITDWFEDVKLISGLFLTGPGYCMNVASSVTFVCNRMDAYPTELKNAVQHNALWDARALRYKVLKTEGKIID